MLLDLFLVLRRDALPVTLGEDKAGHEISDAYIDATAYKGKQLVDCPAKGLESKRRLLYTTDGGARRVYLQKSHRGVMERKG